MKTITLFFILITCALHAQNCEGPLNYVSIFQANNIGAGYNAIGNKFFDGSHAVFFAPYNSPSSPSTMFASAPWVGGYINGDLSIAAQTYGHRDSHDFYSGPLNNSAEILPDICYYFDRVWEITRDDIINHIKDYNDNQIIDKPLSSVFGWPSQGNAFFETYNGFALPVDHNGAWAEFEDLNQNTIYEPDLGEYPIIKLKNKNYIPNHIMWMVFNDQGLHKESEGTPLGIELQLTVYGFLCTEDNTLNNSVFNSYKIINQGASIIDSLFLGSWTDYDLGCHEDDYFGSDSTRNTEYAYNQDSVDGDPGAECSQSVITYAEHPPVQSMTYLSHQMTSYIVLNRVLHFTPQKYFNVLNGLWPDGNPITAFETGYNPGVPIPTTKFMFHGDPSDPSEWAQSNFVANAIDGHTISSIKLGNLEAGHSVTADMVYQFHRNPSLDNLQQVSFMQENVDYILNNLDSITAGCSFFPICNTDDCVWPGDFNHNGIADPFDLIYWGVMTDSSGAQRDGLINWKGHSADNWSLTLPNNLNAKHGDGNGDGVVNYEDLERNTSHYLFTNYLYQPEYDYPQGPEIILEAEPINEEGTIRNFRIKAGKDITDVLGMAYYLEFDTSVFTSSRLITNWPATSNTIIHFDGEYSDVDGGVTLSNYYSAVQNDHQEVFIPADAVFQRSYLGGFKLKEGLSAEDIPDSTIFRLRNLIAIDADGNDLGIGANTLVVYKESLTGVTQIDDDEIFVYPNPADNTIYIDSPVDTNAELMSADGRVVRKLSLSRSTEMNVSDLQQGVYFIKVASSGKTIKIAIQ